MDFKYAIFDLDGTLIDSMFQWRNLQLDAIYDYFGVAFTEEEANELICLDFYDMIDQASKLKSVDISAQLIADESYRRISPYYLDGLFPYKPYALEFLKHLKNIGVKTAIATATAKNFAMPYLEKTGMINYIDGVFTTSDDTNVSKTEGSDVYDIALEYLGGTKEKAVIFEDSLFAIQTAKNNGYTVYAIKDPYQSFRSEMISNTADKYIETYKELID